MQFINGTTELKYLPTGTDSTLLDKIDTIIRINGINKGFICSGEVNPVFLGYMDFGLPINCFTDYCNFLGLDKAVFSYNNELIYVDLVKTEVINGDNDEHIQPYIDEFLNLDMIILRLNSTGEITIYGKNFDNFMTIGMSSSIIINEIKNILPNEFTINYTTSNNIEESNLIVKRGNTFSYGKSIIIKTTDIIAGTGIAGTFNTDFNNGGRGVSLWGNYWELEVFGTIPDVNNFFISSSSGTPSSGTGPNNVSQFSNASFYAFGERSSNNNGVGQYATATTTNFKTVDSINFEYHYTGNANLHFSIRGYNVITNSWDVLWSHDGAGVHAQGDNASLINIDIAEANYTKIQVYFGEATDWSADFAICNINIISV